MPLDAPHDGIGARTARHLLHAVVLYELGIPVRAIFVKFSEAKGWHGCAQSDSTDDRPVTDRLVFLTAGRMAEDHFVCRNHDATWLRDYGEIDCWTAKASRRQSVGSTSMQRKRKRELSCAATTTPPCEFSNGLSSMGASMPTLSNV